jgi:hypothetical protein
VLSDEELKEIEERSERRDVSQIPCGTICLKDRCFRLDIADLLAEVKRLRSGWQSVADGAKPGLKDGDTLNADRPPQVPPAW